MPTTMPPTLPHVFFLYLKIYTHFYSLLFIKISRWKTSSRAILFSFSLLPMRQALKMLSLSLSCTLSVTVLWIGKNWTSDLIFFLSRSFVCWIFCRIFFLFTHFISVYSNWLFSSLSLLLPLHRDSSCKLLHIQW